ncbi:MAG: hypothetical protein GF315_05400 [candidate division Zixibacteria bacterium]|nr:hypothetical protein [candidate division Zixibacteria bacterium]
MNAEIKPLIETLDKLESQLSPSNNDVLDLDTCKESLQELRDESDRLSLWVNLGVHLYHELQNNIIARAKATEILTEETGFLKEISESVQHAGLDPEKLLLCRDRVDREFNRVFNTERISSPETPLSAQRDFSEFKC